MRPRDLAGDVEAEAQALPAVPAAAAAEDGAEERIGDRRRDRITAVFDRQAKAAPLQPADDAYRRFRIAVLHRVRDEIGGELPHSPPVAFDDAVHMPVELDLAAGRGADLADDLLDLGAQVSAGRDLDRQPLPEPAAREVEEIVDQRVH